MARAGASTSTRDIRQQWAQACAGNSGGSSIAADAGRAHSAAGEAAAARTASVVDEAEAADEAVHQAETGSHDGDTEADEAQHAARSGVEQTEIDDDEGLRAADSYKSITMQFFRIIRARLQVELSNRTSGLTDQWLLALLKDNDYWVRARDARAILQRLGKDIDSFAVEYVRDLRVWLPHVEFGIMPVHPVCGSAMHVGMHSWSHINTWVTRRVTALRQDYYIMTCRYWCLDCKKRSLAINSSYTMNSSYRMYRSYTMNSWYTQYKVRIGCIVRIR